jgi:hypothetical protein
LEEKYQGGVVQPPIFLPEINLRQYEQASLIAKQYAVFIEQ